MTQLYIATVVHLKARGRIETVIVDTIEANTIEAATLGAEMKYPNAASITVEEDQHV